MKLDEVAGSSVKCGLIMAAGGNETLDVGDWHGMTEVYTNKTAFFKAVQKHMLDWMDDTSGDEEEVAKVRAAKSMDELGDIDDWESFLRNYWIDDRF